MEKLNRNQVLKEAFTVEPSTEIPAKKQPQKETQSIVFRPSSLTEPNFDLFHFPTVTISKSSFPTSQLLSVNQHISFKIPMGDEIDLFHHLPKDLICPVFSFSSHSLPSPDQILESSLALAPASSPTLDTPPSTTVCYETPLLSCPSLKETSVSPKIPLFTPALQLPEIPSLSELDILSYSDYFDADLIFLPQEGQEGYIFALTLIARPNLELPKIKQNYSFLIDKSNSIQKERLIAVKNAVYKALDELDFDDTFNIIAFDSKIDKLSPIPLPYSMESVKAAKAFLDKIELGSFFSSANLFKPLFLTIPPFVKDNEIHTAIVLTDGELLNKKAHQRSLIYEWTNNNCGRVSLFSLGIGGDVHLSALNTASAFNKGSMVYSPTKGSIKRKLLKLMKTISHPIVKNLCCHAISLNHVNEITLYPKQVQMPHLYLNQPYVILGSTKNLDNFVLFIQGRIKDQWVHIKKKISFAQAKKGGSALKAEWALQRAYKLYEQYIYDADSQHLVEAAKLLEPYNLSVAFQ